MLLREEGYKVRVRGPLFYILIKPKTLIIVNLYIDIS